MLNSESFGGIAATRDRLRAIRYPTTGWPGQIFDFCAPVVWSGTNSLKNSCSMCTSMLPGQTCECHCPLGSCPEEGALTSTTCYEFEGVPTLIRPSLGFKCVTGTWCNDRTTFIMSSSPTTTVVTDVTPSGAGTQPISRATGNVVTTGGTHLATNTAQSSASFVTQPTTTRSSGGDFSCARRGLRTMRCSLTLLCVCALLT